MDNMTLPVRRTERPRGRGTAFIAAFLATMLSLPASAGIDLPGDPLTTGARVPPNILFILDDSGSMAYEYMPDNAPSGWRRQSYVHNTVYYDPSRTYRPWVGADGSLLTGGTEYDAVYGDFNNASGGTIDLSNDWSCRRYNRNNNATSGEMHSGGTQVCGGVQTFYVPIDPDGDLDEASNFYRYQILQDGRVIRSEWLTRSGSWPLYNNGLPLSGCSSTGSSATWRNCTAATPTGRSDEEERKNYATWFSYHRTRMKAAKAGASQAFNELGRDVRVGFRTIWGRGDNHNFPIPVKDNDGLFADETVDGKRYENRSDWYEQLHTAIGYNGTPLHGALDQAGKYFSDDNPNGPYGFANKHNQLACRQNFSILTTDGYWNSNSNFSTSVGNADGTSGSEIEHGVTGETYAYSPEEPYSDSYSRTLADVAMYYWKKDLLPGLDNIVPTTAANPAFWQHMVTFGISIGLKGTLDPAVDEPGDWPNPWRRPGQGSDSWADDHGGPSRIDDLWHAAVNSRGEFVSAADPEEFARGLSGALASIVERTGSFTNVAANSTSLDADTQVFQASYVSGQWTGELSASAISDKKVSPTPSWAASEQIPTSGRKVYTSAGAFPDVLTTEQAEALTRTGSASNYPVTAEQNAAYLAGDRSREAAQGHNLRNRKHLLGDIVGSSPAYVKETETLYVGANDGMLHAFSASTGAELFAFIPDGIDWDALGTLSRPDYTHKYFVDGPVVVSTRAQTPGKNLLVAALGKGGKGLFALDVTSPTSFDQSRVSWQAYETPDQNMGLVQSAPVIARVRTAAGGTTMAAIVSNGVNSANDKAVLLVYDLEDGTLIREIDTGAGSAEAPNGLSGAVGWDSTGDGTVDLVYAGDLLGNVWKFDLGGTADAWSVANAGAPLFTATDADGNRQPISARMTVGMHPANFSTWVFFGTGRFMTVGDVEDRSVQSLYAIRDDGTPASKASLIKRETTVAGTRAGRPVRSFETHEPLPVTTAGGDAVRGWYLDLLEPPDQDELGERIISETQVVNQVLVVASIIPVNDACQSGGRGYLNALDAFTGTSLAGGSFFDLDGDGDFTDEVVGDGENAPPVGSVDLGVGMPTLPNLLRELAVVGGSTGGTGSVPVMDARFTGRVSWREEVED